METLFSHPKVKMFPEEIMYWLQTLLVGGEKKDTEGVVRP